MNMTATEWRGPSEDQPSISISLFFGARLAHGFGIGAGIELRHPALGDLAVRRPGVATVEHVGLALRLEDPPAAAACRSCSDRRVLSSARLARGYGLERRRSDRAQQLDDVRAALGAAQALADGAVEATADAEPDQLLEVGRNVAAHPVGRLVGHGFDIDDA